MNTIVMIDRPGTAQPCAPASVIPHEVAHHAMPSSGAFGAWRRPLEVAPVAFTALRTRGEVSPQAEVAAAGPITDDKSTGASVPGRRGGT